jgi:hypothetical protein
MGDERTLLDDDQLLDSLLAQPNPDQMQEEKDSVRFMFNYSS